MYAFPSITSEVIQNALSKTSRDNKVFEKVHRLFNTTYHILNN